MVELVAILISLAAFVVSCVTLYLTVLSPAVVEVDHVASFEELPGPAFSGPDPINHRMQLVVFVSNTGAHGGLLEEVQIEDLEWHGTGEPYWASLSASELFDPAGAPISTPVVLEAGDVRASSVVAGLNTVGADREERARRVGGIDRVAVTIRWAYFRTAGLLPTQSRLVPSRLRRRRDRVERSERVEIDASTFRDYIVTFWRNNGHENLAQLAGGNR